MRKAVHELKYRNIRALAEPLAGLMHNYISQSPIPADVMVPVPLHKRRLRERGYNQSGLLAKHLSKLTGLPVIDSCLSRQRQTLPQARTQNIEERRRNVQEAFSCSGTELRERRILLIDDVSTSGATLDACALVLKAGGASSVWALVLAREI